MAALPAKKKIQTQAARAEGVRENNLAAFRPLVYVFGLNLALYDKTRQNDAHKNGMFLAAPLAEKEDTETALAEGAREKIWRSFVAAGMGFSSVELEMPKPGKMTLTKTAFWPSLQPKTIQTQGVRAEGACD